MALRNIREWDSILPAPELVVSHQLAPRKPPLDRHQTSQAALSGQNWHLNILKLVGSWVAKGNTDEEIHTLSARHTLAGYTPDQTRHEVQVMINSARHKGFDQNLPVLDTTDLDLVVNLKGAAVFNTHNVKQILLKTEAWVGVFAYDEFTQRKMVLKKLPNARGNPLKFKPREIKDSDYTEVIAWFNRNGFATATKTAIADCIDAVCEESIISPVRHWLETLSEGDQATTEDDALLNQWLLKFLNVKAIDDDQRRYVSAVGRKWLISAVARAMNAGCKADCVLILEGKQGVGKSTALRILASDAWFGDALPHMGSKDASDYIRGKWIVELAELSNINKAEVEVVKAFVSRKEERFRPAYGRNEITYPRQCVFAGSTNKSDYLRDETGNRRFWPVTCGKVDTAGLEAHRVALWRAAVVAYKSGEKWWLEEEMEALARGEQGQRLSVDLWVDIINDYCRGKSEVSVNEVAFLALDLEKGRVGRVEQNRITAALTMLGFTKAGRCKHGIGRDSNRYVHDGTT